MISPYDPEIPKEASLRLKGQLHCHWYDDGQLPGLLGLGGLETPLFDLTRKPARTTLRCGCGSGLQRCQPVGW